jgi:hypothetical protein
VTLIQTRNRPSLSPAGSRDSCSGICDFGRRASLDHRNRDGICDLHFTCFTRFQNGCQQKRRQCCFLLEPPILIKDTTLPHREGQHDNGCSYQPSLKICLCASFLGVTWQALREGGPAWDRKGKRHLISLICTEYNPNVSQTLLGVDLIGKKKGQICWLRGSCTCDWRLDVRSGLVNQTATSVQLGMPRHWTRRTTVHTSPQVAFNMSTCCACTYAYQPVVAKLWWAMHA